MFLRKPLWVSIKGGFGTVLLLLHLSSFGLQPHTYTAPRAQNGGFTCVRGNKCSQEFGFTSLQVFWTSFFLKKYFQVSFKSFPPLACFRRAYSKNAPVICDPYHLHGNRYGCSQSSTSLHMHISVFFPFPFLFLPFILLIQLKKKTL